MLILTRKKDESIMINDNIEITLIEIEDGKVKLGINAPKEIKIHRKEIYDIIVEENKAALKSQTSLDQLKKMMNAKKK
jgi:carbon storage regulator